MKRYVYVNNLWKDAEFTRLKGVDRLAYRSNKLGADQRITNTGGGNTSSKLLETDPLTGRKVEVLWVKDSGGDLRTSRRDNVEVEIAMDVAKDEALENWNQKKRDDW